MKVWQVSWVCPAGSSEGVGPRPRVDCSCAFITVSHRKTFFFFFKIFDKVKLLFAGLSTNTVKEIVEDFQANGADLVTTVGV